MNAATDAKNIALLEAVLYGLGRICRSAPTVNHNIMHGLLSGRNFWPMPQRLAQYPKGAFRRRRRRRAWLGACPLGWRGQYVKPGGFILFDNSDRWQYNAGYRSAEQPGLSNASTITVPVPVNVIEWCTSNLCERFLAAFMSNIDSPKGDNDLGW